MPPQIPGSEAFIKEDVRSVLQALADTTRLLAAEMGPEAEQYARGYNTGIKMIAKAFDIRIEEEQDRW